MGTVVICHLRGLFQGLRCKAPSPAHGQLMSWWGEMSTRPGWVAALSGSGPPVLHSLAKNDAVFETVHEVVAYATTCHALDPLSKLLFPLEVILLGQLVGSGGGAWR